MKVMHTGILISALMTLSYISINVSGLRQTLRREIILRQINHCGLCQDKFTKMKPHEIHHLNHKPKDNNASNLLALCANCHTAHHRFGVSVMPFINIKNMTDDVSGGSKVYYE